MSAPSPPSTPPPVATAEQACALREDLTASGWGVESTRRLLGPVADDALRREIRLPALRAVRAALADSRATGAAPSPVAVLTALFMLGEPVGADELDAALPRTGAGGALAMGLVRPAGAGGPDAAAPSSCPGPRPAVVRTAVDLRPHEAVDDTGDVRWWIASDIGELTTGHELAPDHVLGIGGAGLTLAGLTPRAPVAAALDLGCGCGIQTLYLLRHADRVTATDISARALAFTAFNAALAGTGPDRLELVRGSLLEPLAGRDFDLIATNPPFVLTPPAVREAGLPLMEYRDAGTPVLPALVPAVGEHLRPGASDPTVILIHQGGGLGRTVRADTALAALVDVADGELSVAQIAGAVAALTGLTGLTGPAGAEAEALRADLVAATRALAGDGFLTLR